MRGNFGSCIRYQIVNRNLKIYGYRYFHSIYKLLFTTKWEALPCRRGLFFAGGWRRPESLVPLLSNFTVTRFDTPCSCMVTPYSTLAMPIVRLLCVMTMNWLKFKKFLHDGSRSGRCWLHPMRRPLRPICRMAKACSLKNRQHQGHGCCMVFSTAGKQTDRLLSLAGREAGQDFDARFQHIIRVFRGSDRHFCRRQRQKSLRNISWNSTCIQCVQRYRRSVCRESSLISALADEFF